MDFLGSMSGSVSLDVNVDLNIASKVEKKSQIVSSMQSNIQSQTKTVIQKTTVVENAGNEFQIKIDRLMKENGSLRQQLMQVQKVLGNLTKELNQIKQTKAFKNNNSDENYK